MPCILMKNGARYHVSDETLKDKEFVDFLRKLNEKSKESDSSPEFQTNNDPQKELKTPFVNTAS